jgi:hypothetical protein
MNIVPNIGMVVMYEEIPALMRLVRRGRTFEEVSQESGLTSGTWRRAELGLDLSLVTLKAIAKFTNTNILVGPNTEIKTDYAPEL